MKNEKSYSQLENELHVILSKVENESYDELDDLLKDYDNGMKLITELEQKLKNAKNSITKINPS